MHYLNSYCNFVLILITLYKCLGFSDMRVTGLLAFPVIKCYPCEMKLLSYLTSPHLTSPHLTSPHLTSPHLTSLHLTSPYLTSPYLTSPHLTSPHLIHILFVHTDQIPSRKLWKKTKFTSWLLWWKKARVQIIYELAFVYQTDNMNCHWNTEYLQVRIDSKEVQYTENIYTKTV